MSDGLMHRAPCSVKCGYASQKIYIASSMSCRLGSRRFSSNLALAAADEQHRLILEWAPYALGVSDLDIDCLDVLFGMDFEYQGNHDEILAEALFSESAFATLLDVPGVKPLSFDPSVMLSLSSDCRLQAKVSLESRTGAYQMRTGKFKEEDQLSLYLSIRQYPDPEQKFSRVDSYNHQRNLCEEWMNTRLIPYFINPIVGAIAQRR